MIKKTRNREETAGSILEQAKMAVAVAHSAWAAGGPYGSVKPWPKLNVDNKK